MFTGFNKSRYIIVLLQASNHCTLTELIPKNAIFFPLKDNYFFSRYIIYFEYSIIFLITFDMRTANKRYIYNYISIMILYNIDDYNIK